MMNSGPMEVENEGILPLKRKKCIKENLQDRDVDELEKLLKNIDINPKKFNGPGQRPKTANKAFGGLSDYALFFENRNSEMKEFAEKFKSIEKKDLESSMDELSRVIIPKIDECLDKMYKRIRATKKLKHRYKNKYADLFQGKLDTWEDFYKRIFRAYTINGFLFEEMNKHLRNEDWIQLDALLPYTYCLLKAFLWGSTGMTVKENFEALKNRSIKNKLILYRRADFDDNSLNFYDVQKIKNFSWNGVTSTSLIESITKKFQRDRSKRTVLITIEIDFEDLQPESLNALYLATFSAFRKEEEVALPPGSVFELLEINKDKPEVEMRLKLMTNVKILAHSGQFMHGMLQAIMWSEGELKMVSLKEKELSRAITHCKGNKLIKDLEFCFCTFNRKAIGIFREVIPTINNLTTLILNIVKFEEGGQIDGILECIEKTEIKKLQILATLSQKRNIEDMIKSFKYLSSLKYLEISLEEDCQIDANLLRGFFVAGYQHLNLGCIFDVRIGLSYNFITRGSNLNVFEQLGLIKEMSQNWPAGWGSPPKGLSEMNSLTFDPQMKQHLETTKIEEDGSIGDLEIKDTSILDHFELKDERNENIENIEIIESSRGFRRYCLEGVREGTLLEVLENKFMFTSEKKRNKTHTIDGDNQDTIQEEFQSRGREGTKQLGLSTDLYLSFERDHISDEEVNILCSHGIRHFQSLKALNLIFNGCKDFSNKWMSILSCQGIQKLKSLTSLTLGFRSCQEITDEGLKTLVSEGIRYLPLLTSLILDFEGCKEVTDIGLKTLGCKGIRHLPLLTSLDLYFGFCQRITDEGLKTLVSKGIRHLPLLTSLHLDFRCCKKITDEGLKILKYKGIQHLPLLTSLDLNFAKCYFIKETRQSILSWLQSKKDLLAIGQHQGLHTLNLSTNFSRSPFQGLSNSNQKTPFTIYHDIPSFYFKETPFKCEPNIPQLLGKHSPFHVEDFGGIIYGNCFSEETQKNYQATFHLNFKSKSIGDGISNLDDAASSWQNVKTLNLIFHDCSLITLQRLQICWNILRCFKSIVELNIRSNEAHFPLDEGFSSLFDHDRFENLKFLKRINLIFPKAKISETAKTNLFKASSSFALNLLTLKKEIKTDLKMNKQSVQSCIFMKKWRIFRTKGHEIHMSLQNSLEKSNLFLSEIFGEMGPVQNSQIKACKQRNWKSEFKSTLNEDICKRHFDCQEKITNSQENFKSFPSREIAFSENQNISIQELNSQELLSLESLLVLDLNFSGHNDFTNVILQALVVRMSDFESLKVLSLSFYGCRLVTDEGLLNLSSQGLKQLRKLTELSLDFGLCNSITDKGIGCLSCEGIKHLELLTKLHLNFEWCQLVTDKGFEIFGNNLTESLQLLTDLHLSFQNCPNILDFESKRLLTGLKNLKLLTFLSLDFGHCKVYDQDIQNLSKGIQNLESLIDLRLKFNNSVITDRGLGQLSDCLKNLKSLNTLSLNFDKCSRISDQGIQYLSCQRIQYLKSITSLNFSFDGDASSILTNKGLQSLCCEGIRHLTSLVFLSLNFYIHEGISDEGLESLCCEGIQHLDKLMSLGLICQGKNKITDQGIKSLAFKAMSKLISLENLQLPLMQTVTYSSSIVEAFKNILIYFGLHQDSNL